MALYTLHFFDLAYISTDDPDGFSDNGGYQFDLGVNTVTIAPGSVSQTLTVDDIGDGFFDDDKGAGQTLSGAHTLNGTPYPDGTILESEYELTVQDSLGNNYVLQFVSVNNDAYNIEGFVVQGAMPPWNQPLTIVGRSDNTDNVYSYAGSTPVCFAADTLIDTALGPRRAGALRPGMALRLAGGGFARLRMVLHSPTRLSGGLRDAPIRFRAGALGPGRPARDLILSPQHRLPLPGQNAAGAQLAPARAFACLPRIGPVKGLRHIDYVHLVLARHALLMAEGLEAESFWPGPMAMAGLSHGAARAVTATMGSNPRPAGQLVAVRAARAALAPGRQAWGAARDGA